MTIEDKTIVSVNQQGFRAATQKEDAVNYSYTIHFSRINYISYDMIANILAIGLIGGEKKSVFEVSEDDYISISYAYRTWST